MRGFKNAVNDGREGVASNPEDYSLFYIANYDDDKAVYENVVHEQVVTALELAKKE